jgi:hypothetical protein
MTTQLEKLVKLGAPVRGVPVDRVRLEGVLERGQVEALMPLLQLANGFYAFESALHVFADTGPAPEQGLVEWNDKGTWISEYGGMADGGIYFAEDIFGTQFCLRAGVVATFDPETGAFETMASSIEDWAYNVLRDPGLWTGHPLAHQWQADHGAIEPGRRLIPKRPFVMGGEFACDNLYVADAVKAMRYRGSVAVQIRDLPDGTPITLKVVE